MREKESSEASFQWSTGMQRLGLLRMWDRWHRDIEFYRSYKVYTSKSGSLNGCVLVSTTPIYFMKEIMVLLGLTFLVLFAWLLLLMCYFRVAYFVSACQGNKTDVVLCSYDDHFLVSSKFLFIWIFFIGGPPIGDGVLMASCLCALLMFEKLLGDCNSNRSHGDNTPCQVCIFFSLNYWSNPVKWDFFVAS